MVESRCGSCRFHALLDGDIMCDYMQHAGRSRTSQLGPGDKDKPCRFYEPGKTVRMMFKPVVDSQKAQPRYRFDQRKMRQLYDKGLSDHQIAREMGCTDTCVLKFRRKNRLEANYRPGGGKRKEAESC